MTYTVSVRALCDFTAKRGDLDRRFTPAPTAREGQYAHTLAASRRGGGYQKELALFLEHEGLSVRGRADGYDSDEHRLDEFKSFRGDLARVKDNHRALHWAQLKSYGAMLLLRDGKPAIDLALTYIDIDSQNETVLAERVDAKPLIEWFYDRCDEFSAWATQETAHRSARNDALRGLQFPFPDFRHGQRLLAEAVYRAARNGTCLLAQAPTGIGKTLGTIYPLLKAMGEGRIDKIYYLTAKSTGHHLALEALTLIKDFDTQLPLRTLELTAREKSCVHPQYDCHGASCPLAKGFYDRLPEARAAAVKRGSIDQMSLRAIAENHHVCPYYLGQEMLRWADVVIGDYNYFFDDSSGILLKLQADNEWRVGLLVDEAHNLIPRGRQMYTASLGEAQLTDALTQIPTTIRASLSALLESWQRLCTGEANNYTEIASMPTEFLQNLKRLVGGLSEINLLQEKRFPPEVERLFFAALRFCRLADSFAEHSLLDVASGTLCIRNVVPAAFLKKCFAAAHCAVLFSATLNPPVFYRDMLGLPTETASIDVPSPFDPEQLRIHLVHNISTRWHKRASTLQPISAVIARGYVHQPGNYLVFASSFEYLNRLFGTFTSRYPDIKSWKQTPRMNDIERQRFIDEFQPEGAGIGFAVLGGAFAEGVDLPGTRLIGAFIATLGLPPVDAANEAMAERLQTIFGSGREYVYLYPGLQKVIQAAGRIIRSPSDAGNLYLIDDRYGHAEVQRQLPRWWALNKTSAH